MFALLPFLCLAPAPLPLLEVRLHVKGRAWRTFPATVNVAQQTLTNDGKPERFKASATQLAILTAVAREPACGVMLNVVETTEAPYRWRVYKIEVYEHED